MLILNQLSIPSAYRLLVAKRIKAECLSSDAVGDCVYIRDAGIPDFYRVEKADPADVTKMPAVGIIIEKFSTTGCYVQVAGDLSTFSGLTPNGLVYVGLDGRPTQEPHVEYLQTLGYALDTDTVFLSFSAALNMFEDIWLGHITRVLDGEVKRIREDFQLFHCGLFLVEEELIIDGELCLE